MGTLVIALAAILACNEETGAPARTDLFDDPLPTGAVARLGTERFRACGSAEALAYAPDGSSLAVAGGNGDVRVFDREGREWRRWTIGRGELRAITYSSDGKFVAAAGKHDCQTIVVWDLKANRRAAALVGHKWGVTALV